MKLPYATIAGPATDDGYYLGIIEATGERVTGVSIFRDTLATGSACVVIQCGSLASGSAEYGFALVSKGLRGIVEFPQASTALLAREGPYSVAASAIGYLAGNTRAPYYRARVTAVGSLSLTVTPYDGDVTRASMVLPVEPWNGLTASQFTAGEAVLVSNVGTSPAVVGWWEPDTAIVYDLIAITVYTYGSAGYWDAFCEKAFGGSIAVPDAAYTKTVTKGIQKTGKSFPALGEKSYTTGIGGSGSPTMIYKEAMINYNNGYINRAILPFARSDDQAAAGQQRRTWPYLRQEDDYGATSEAAASAVIESAQVSGTTFYFTLYSTEREMGSALENLAIERVGNWYEDSFITRIGNI